MDIYIYLCKTAKQECVPHQLLEIHKCAKISNKQIINLQGRGEVHTDLLLVSLRACTTRKTLAEMGGKIGCGREWADLAQDRGKWRALVNTVNKMHGI